MLKNTYKNLFLLKRIGETTSSYRRDKFLNDWVVSPRSTFTFHLMPVTTRVARVVLFSVVPVCDCLSVCLSVNAITPEPLEISSVTKFSWHHHRVLMADKFKDGYVGVRDGEITYLMF